MFQKITSNVSWCIWDNDGKLLVHEDAIERFDDTPDHGEEIRFEELRAALLAWLADTYPSHFMNDKSRLREALSMSRKDMEEFVATLKESQRAPAYEDGETWDAEFAHD